MNADSMPVILARWIKDEDGQTYLENQKLRVKLNPKRIEEIYALYRLANGYRSIAEICSNVSQAYALSFFNQLTDVGMCFASTSLAMYGHQAGNFPDPLRPKLTSNEVEGLQRLEPDQEGIRIPTNDTIYSERVSCRLFDESPIPWLELEKILLSSYGITGKGEGFLRRPIPSAGAMFPLKHEIFVLRSDIPAAHYRWAMNENALIRCADLDLDSLKEVFFEDAWMAAALVHVIGFDIRRSLKKYSSRAYRFAILEAGHAAQNAIGAAVDQGIGNWEYGGYDDVKLEKICGLTNSTSGVATVLFYGGRK